MSPRAGGANRFRPSLLIPAVGVPVAVAVAVLVPMQATAAVDLPDKTVEELIEFARSSDVDAFSGTIEQRSELGLPDLGVITGGTGGGMGPGAGAEGDADAEGATSADLDDLIALLTGSFDANVYLDQDHARLQVLDRLAERNVYLSPGEAWFVDSETKTATRLTLPEGVDLEQLQADAQAEAERLAAEARARAEAELPDGEQLPSPQQLLDRALDRLDETTEVAVGTDGRVAGREAYELVLTPRTGETLVGEVRFAIDGENGAALAASVTARGATDPAFSIGFTEVDFSAPDPSVFAFEPADDLTVTEEVVPIPTAEEQAQWKAEARAEGDDGVAPDVDAEVPDPVVHGEGWATVVEVDAAAIMAALGEHRGETADGPAGDDAGGAPSEEQLAEASAALEALTTPVDGGRALQTSLLSVLLTDDGRVLAGSVPVDTLVEYAAESGR